MKSCNQFGAARSEDLQKITFSTPHQFRIHFKTTILKLYLLAVAGQEDARATRSLLLRPVAANGKRLQQSRANNGI